MKGLRLGPTSHYLGADGRIVGQPTPLPDDVSSFEFLFAPIFPSLNWYYWLFQESPFNLTGRRNLAVNELLLDHFDELVEVRSRGCVALPDTVLPALADHVKDDWAELFGVKEQPDPDRFFRELQAAAEVDRERYEDLAREHRGSYNRLTAKVRKLAQERGWERNRYVAETVDVYFHNVDGAFWEFYSRDPVELDTIRRHCGAIAGLRVGEVDVLTADLD